MNNNLLDLNNLVACIYAEVISNMYEHYKKHSEYTEAKFKEIVKGKSEMILSKRTDMLDEFVSEYMRRTVKLSGNTVIAFNKDFDKDSSLVRLTESIFNNTFILHNIDEGKMIMVFAGVDRDTASGGNGKVLNSILNTIKEYDVTYQEYYIKFGTKATLINNNGTFNSKYYKFNNIENTDSVSSYKINKRTGFAIPHGVNHCFAIVLDVSNELYTNEIEYTEIEEYDEKMDMNNRHIFSALRGIVNKDYMWYTFNDIDLMDDLINLKDKMI
ncbi:MAG: hypothetical protein ACRCXT_02395 [Paraclostridium sp.]